MGVSTGFVQWRLQAGHATTSINRRLSTLKTYATLAAQAGAISARIWRLFKRCGYGQKEAKAHQRNWKVTRIGHKGGAYRLTNDQADALKAQPMTTPRPARRGSYGALVGSWAALWEVAL